MYLYFICSLQVFLNTYGIQTQTPQQVEPIQIWAQKELVKVRISAFKIIYPSVYFFYKNNDLYQAISLVSNSPKLLSTYFCPNAVARCAGTGSYRCL